MTEIRIKDKAEMIQFAQNFAKTTAENTIIGLKGTLGAGKTFFAQNFINSLQESPTQITSPTFNLISSYSTKKGEVFHLDLYRLKSPEELENIGFFDILKNGICLIEWPEIAIKSLEKLPNYQEITIKLQENDERIIQIHS